MRPSSRIAGAGERRGDLIGIGGNAQAPLAVERGERAEPAMHGLGETEELEGVIGKRQGALPRGGGAEPMTIGVAMGAGISGALARAG
jgi:hypothetical protein